MSVPAPINIDSVPDQIGTAIMKANPNKFELVKASGEMINDNHADCITIHSMLKDVARCLSSEPMKKMTVMLGTYSYTVTLDATYIYVVKSNQ